MSEEVETSTWSDLKKTIIGTIGTLVAAGGAWLGSQLFGANEEPAQQPAQQAQPVINFNVQNTNTQQQSAGGGKTVIVKEKEVPAKESKPVTTQKKKEGDEFKEQAPQW